MANPFFITIILIALVTLIGAFIKGRSKDRCLVDFKDLNVTAEFKDGKFIWGNLNVQPTGIELVYDEDYLDEKDGHIERSSIVYKNELNGIDAIVCYHEKLNPEQVKRREIRLKRYYQSNTPYLLKRRVVNFFYTVRDAIMDVSALFIGRMRSSPLRLVPLCLDRINMCLRYSNLSFLQLLILLSHYLKSILAKK